MAQVLHRRATTTAAASSLGNRSLKARSDMDWLMLR